MLSILADVIGIAGGVLFVFLGIRGKVIAHKNGKRANEKTENDGDGPK